MKKQLLLVALLSVGVMNIEAATTTMNAKDKQTAGKEGVTGVFTKLVTKLSAARQSATGSPAIKKAIRFGIAALKAIQYGTDYGKAYLKATGLGATQADINAFKALRPSVSLFYLGLAGVIVQQIDKNENKITDLIKDITGQVNKVLTFVPLLESDVIDPVTDLLEAFLTNVYVDVYTAIKGQSLSQEQKVALAQQKAETEAAAEAAFAMDLDDL